MLRSAPQFISCEIVTKSCKLVETCIAACPKEKKEEKYNTRAIL